MLGAVLASALGAAPAAAQVVSQRVVVRLTSEGAPVPEVLVRLGDVAGASDTTGRVLLRVPTGTWPLAINAIGFRPVRRTIVASGSDTVRVDIELEAAGYELEGLTVATTRSERRLGETALRVEVIDEEELDEKVQMTPGSIAMALGETNGLRVQSTAPSLGAANVRVQGLSGRYTAMLADGLPLVGEAQGLGVLQIPPVDLGRIEVVKGPASALYGAGALGGMVNLISREAATARELLANVTSRGGADATGWLAGDLGGRWSASLLAGAHTQQRQDIDADGWTDMAGFRRGHARARVSADGESGRTFFGTLGVTVEDRAGGTLPGATAPDGQPYAESLNTRRVDLGLVHRRALAGRVLAMRAGLVWSPYTRVAGAAREEGTTVTAMGEGSVTFSTGPRGALVLGTAFQGDRFTTDLPGLGYDWETWSVFGQLDHSFAEWLIGSLSARGDFHSEAGTIVSPRASLLWRPGPWRLRLSAGAGFTPAGPFIDATATTGLVGVVNPGGLEAERGRSLSLDASGMVGGLEVQVTAFAHEVRHPLQLRPPGALPGARAVLATAATPARSSGGEALARWRRGPLTVTATYGYLWATDEDPLTQQGRESPLNPRHSAGLVAVLEREHSGRIGLELYHIGRQALDDDPYRSHSEAYTLLGLLGQKDLGPFQVWLNLENLLGVRLADWQPLVRPSRDAVGNWTVGAWAPLDGFTANIGVRIRGGVGSGKLEVGRWQ